MRKIRSGNCASVSTPKGRALEVVVLTFGNGNELIIHAMKAREQYLALLK